MKKTALLLTALIALNACMYNRSGRPYRSHRASQPTAAQIHGAKGQLTPGRPYTIQRGDTLFGIAWRYGLDIDDLARWNRITDKDRIYAGEQLRTTPPKGTPAPKPVKSPNVTRTGQSGWIWPTRGRVIQTYAKNAIGQQGIRISGRRGQAIHASSGGEVAYVGTKISGFGRMVIIAHSGRIYSAYGYLDTTAVQEHQQVRRGQTIGTMGIGPNGSPTLHFETRKKGQSVNPYSYIGTQPRY